MECKKSMNVYLNVFVCLCMIFYGCTEKTATKDLAKASFEKDWKGKKTGLAILKNKNGMDVAITNYGARLVSGRVADKKGKQTDVVVGFNSIDEYIQAQGRSYGAAIGRFANRIAAGRFTIDGQQYQLPQNNNGNNIHGGPMGFNEQVWNWVAVSNTMVKLSYLSKDGENGFPGNLNTTLIYTLNDENEIRIEYIAETDKKTVINVTNHSYFNLDGHGGISDYEVFIDADQYTPVNEQLIPTGELKPVTGTPFDLRKPTIIRDVVDMPDTQLKYAGGFDHNFVLNKKQNHNEPQLAATAYSPHSGILMSVFTTEPGLQFFTANSLKGADTGRDGHPINAREAFCFETQHFPDAPNHPHFPTTELAPGKKFTSVTVYRFEVH